MVDLQNAAGALLTERIHLLGEAAQQAVLFLVLQHVLHHQGAGFRHGHPFDPNLPSQLRVYGALLLQIRSHDVQDGCLRETYGGCWNTDTAVGHWTGVLVAVNKRLTESLEFFRFNFQLTFRSYVGERR